MNTAFCTIFAGPRRVARVADSYAASMARQILADDPAARVLVFDEAGRQVDLDFRDEAHESATGAAPPAPAAETRGRGRPKLGVVAREVTLLPRHWDWLNAQPGGASVALRKLVENARRENAESDRRREAREAAYRFLSAIAGDLPGFEEASRALFAGDRARFAENVSGWPGDVAAHARWLAFREGEP
ncbi:DUF2239 family protein [Rhodoblastus acidophilus]|uniref:DUF2239 family protein n=1 Tax=Candidatus Rhodoblastus alkanivorans TaxID=2954117 RepID=A0ABS9Z7K2_9HYPH|nr:DUF2239 family protein [Candidatus Rhodoblastus alkanivorans]MCI4678319.1 DUF2239 family protein [Candidatus Rhodoblastus alkanivorans]MCI4683577.1 DUF2239 family protein [Candidatus Rhodoblastus alkanivorans]MDI4640892.1 DUF2239 family protein [Rhodoblastus acidophilus]